jgi:HNH endonuclease
MGEPPSDMTSRCCIYCLAELSAKTRWAHVWPAALGGKLKSRVICCNDCNNAISTSERSLFEALRHPFASVGAVNDQREPVEVLMEYEGREFLLANGVADLQAADVRFDPSTRKVIVPLPSGLSEQATRAAKALWRHGLGINDVDKFHIEPNDQVPTLPDGPTLNEYDVSVGRKTEHKRVFVKIALELLAFHRNELAIRDELSTARGFARYGTGDLRAWVDTRSRGSGLVPFDGLPEVFNAVETWTSGKLVLFRIIFLGPFMFTGVLTSEWLGEPFRAAYAFDARDPAKKIVDTFLEGMGRPLATWFMRNETAHCAATLKAISLRLAIERANATPVREAPPDIDDLRAAMRTRLSVMPPKKQRK